MLVKSMAREFSKAFYNSSVWKKTARLYKNNVFGICEKCGHEGHIVHHKIHLTPFNMNDPSITLSLDNLMYLCLECHNAIHAKEEMNSRQSVFDSDGNMIGIIDEAPPLSG